MSIQDSINSINQKNDLLPLPASGHKRAKLTRPLLKKILKGIEISRPRKQLADELSISRELINDVIQEFEITYPASAGKVLRMLDEEFISFKEELHKEERKKETTTPPPAKKTEQTSPPPIAGVIYTKPNYDAIKRKEVENAPKRIVEERDEIPDHYLRAFKNDMEFGYRRLLVKYGEGSELGLSPQAIKAKVLQIRPDIQKWDPEYFNNEEIQG